MNRPVTAKAYLRRQALEKREWTLVLDQILDYDNAADLLLEVRVLYPGFDRVQWRRNGNRSNSTRNRRDKILRSRRLVVVLQSEDNIPSQRRRTEQLPRKNP